MNTNREINGRNLSRLSYVRQGESVDPKTGEVFRTYRDIDDNRQRTIARGYVTERWMRNHGWIG